MMWISVSSSSPQEHIGVAEIAYLGSLQCPIIALDTTPIHFEQIFSALCELHFRTLSSVTNTFLWQTVTKMHKNVVYDTNYLWRILIWCTITHMISTFDAIIHLQYPCCINKYSLRYNFEQDFMHVIEGERSRMPYFKFFRIFCTEFKLSSLRLRMPDQFIFNSLYDYGDKCNRTESDVLMLYVSTTTSSPKFT